MWGLSHPNGAGILWTLSVGLIIRCVGLKLNCGVYVGQLTWDFYFIVGEEGYEFLFL